MRTKICLVGLVAFVCLGQPIAAQQSLNVALFERYLVLLREQIAIPGLSGAIVQGGRVVWHGGFGHADVAAAAPARSDTPYPVLGLSQAVSATLLLQQCVDFSHLEVSDRVRRWVPDHPDETLTVAEVLSHTVNGGYAYDPGRYALVDRILEQCANADYPALLAGRVLDAFAMTDSVPGADLADQLDRYAALMLRVATPYRVDDRGRVTATAYSHPPATAASGLISSALDLAQFDIAVRNGGLATADTLRLAWSPVGTGPAGLGWLVQRVGADTVVWQFGVATDAYSSLIIKVPGRDLTLVLLANSDRLASPYAVASPDVNASVFARLFFRIFLG